MLSSAITKIISGDPAVNDWEPIFLLLTVDDDGFARVCLLSRGQVEVSADFIKCVVRGRRTAKNLERNATATFMVSGNAEVFYLRIRISSKKWHTSDTLLLTFSVISEEVDTAGVPLQPFRFFATEELRQVERWEQSKGLLQEEKT